MRPETLRCWCGLGCLVNILLASSIAAAPRQAATAKPVPRSTTPPQSRAASPTAPSYVTAPFDISVRKLPANYRGHSIAAVFDRLLRTGEKGEFETSAEYAKRLPRSKPGERWAFVLDGPVIEYDADAEEFSVFVFENENRFFESGRSIPIRTITVHEIATGARTYRATNAFGAAVDVKAVSSTRYELGLYGQVPGKGKPIYHKYVVPVVRAQAEQLKQRLGVLFICDPNPLNDEDSVASTGLAASAATFQEPIERSVEFRYLDVTMVSVWLFNKSTGQVLVRDDKFALGDTVR
jgi:hypothetical protein